MGTWNTLFPVDQPVINLSAPDNNPLTFEGQVSGYLSSSNYNDTYPIYLQTGYKYDFVTVNDGSGSGSRGAGLLGVWSDILIYDSNGDLLKLNRATSSETIGYNGDIFDFEVTKSGTYYVSESMYFLTDRGSYSLAINIDPPATTTPTLPSTPSTGGGSSNSVFRFFNNQNGMHFFTASSAERDNIISNMPNYNYEGVAFNSASVSTTNSVGVYRFYHPSNGAHFYTASTAERDNIIQNLSGSFSYEGEAFRALPGDQSSSTSTPVYRFYNIGTDSHFFTTSTAERDNVINNLSGSYRYEGIAYNVPIASANASPAASALVPDAAAPVFGALEVSTPALGDQGLELVDVLPQFAAATSNQELVWTGTTNEFVEPSYAGFVASSHGNEWASMLTAG